MMERGMKYVNNLNAIPSSTVPASPHSASLAAGGLSPHSASAFGPVYSALELPLPSSHVVKRAGIASSSFNASGLSAGLAATQSTRMTGEIDYAALVGILATANIQPHDREFVSHRNCCERMHALLCRATTHDVTLFAFLLFCISFRSLTPHHTSPVCCSNRRRRLIRTSRSCWRLRILRHTRTRGRHDMRSCCHHLPSSSHFIVQACLISSIQNSIVASQ